MHKMAPKAIVMGVVVLALVLVSTTLVTAQSNCMSVLVGMASCLNYVSGSAATPSVSCCTALANVVKTQPRCLCTIVNGGSGSLGVNINQTLALGLPSVCKVETPPTSRCNAVNGPAMSPVGSPEGAPAPESGDGGISGSDSPSVTGSKTTPANGSNSKGSTTTINVAATIVVFVTASYASAAFNIFSI